MISTVIPLFYSIEQLREQWGCNPLQIYEIISRHNHPFHACIADKKGINLKPVKIYEAKINTATGDDLKKFGSFTHDELKEQGFIISSINPNLYCAQKGTISLDIDYSDAVKKIGFSDFNREAYDIPHENYVELCHESPVYLHKKVAHLFANDQSNIEEKLLIKIIKCEKNGYFRFLEPAHWIRLRDIYVHYGYVHKIEEQPKLDDATTNSKQDIDKFINITLKTDLHILISKMATEYSGQIAKKTSAPHRLIIKVMLMMSQLQYQDITWTTVKEFIEEHIWGHHERTTLANLDSLDDNAITVNGIELNKNNASRRVSEYKNKFGINTRNKIKT